MPLVTAKGLTQTTDNCFLHTQDLGGIIYTVAMVGIIHRQSSKGRDNPPPCRNGFDCGGTPFAYGHVMALELGGPDISDNIVPQYGMWQGLQTGDWRKTEIAIYNGSLSTHQVMVVALDYNFAATDNYAAIKQAFANGNKLLHWTDPRIPTRFGVWVTAANWSSGSVKMDDYLKADRTGKESLIAPLIKELDRTTAVLRQTIDAMPEVDRQYWRGQMVNALARQQFQEYENAAIVARDTALANLAPQSGGRVSRRVASTKGARAASSPYGGNPIPPDPLVYHKWLAQDNVQTELAAMINNDTNGCAVGWTAVEKSAFTATSVNNTVFG